MDEQMPEKVTQEEVLDFLHRNDQPCLEVTVTIKVPMERIEALLCDAFEGDSNYWYVITGYNYPEGQTRESLGIEFPHMQLPLRGGSLLIGELEGPCKSRKLDMKAIKRGLEIMAKEYPQDFADFLEENDDADTGDIFLQCALFGKVVFG